MQTDWQQRRSAFNHDWLKNDFLNSLNAFITLLDYRAPDQGEILKFLKEKLPVWPEKAAEAKWLIESFEVEMSPKQFFGVPPLCNCDEETKGWLPGLVHDLWLARYPVTELLHSGQRALAGVIEKYQALRLEALRAEAIPFDSLRGMKNAFVAFKDACDALSVVLSQMDIKVKRV
jgi:hypothetical protein